MAAPKLVKLVAVKVAASTIGEFVIIRNLTRGGQLTDQVVGTGREVIFNPAPDIEWQEKDLIQAEIRGRLQGVAQATINNGGAQIKIVAAADTTTPGVSL